MSDAILFVFDIFYRLIDLLFNQIKIVDGVYLGWVILAISLFIMIIRSVLNVPNGVSFKHQSDKKGE